VVGSSRQRLIRQFLGESLLFSFIALSVALLIVEIFLTTFNSLFEKSISISYPEDVWLIPVCLAVALVVGILAGSYPGIYLSSFHPAEALKGNIKSGKRPKNFRRGLVVFQFAVTITLVASTLIIYTQMKYVENKNLGFDKENIIILPIRDIELRKKYETVKSELMRHPSVISVAASSGTPLMGGVITDLNESRFQIKMIDHDYISLLGMEIVKGRNFYRNHKAESDSLIINETAARMLEWEEPIGKEFRGGYGRGSKPGWIIGLVKDFHNNSLHKPIEPLVFQLYPAMFSNFLIKLHMDNFKETRKFLEMIWKEFVPHRPFEFSFLDDEYKRLYRTEQRIGKILQWFSLLAIFIACLGLMGLSSYTSIAKTKEIGVRKILGASVAGIVVLLSREFLKWIIIANVVAWPLAYVIMIQWLQRFAYRTGPSLWVFVVSGFLAGIISILTISCQTIKASLLSPIKSLRYE
jgi:putative ABC transport system permease protein